MTGRTQISSQLILDGSIRTEDLQDLAVIDTKLSVTGVAAGTFTKITVNTKGRVVAAENPTTLAEFGITNAQPLDSDLTALANTITTGLYAITAVGTSTTRTIVSGSTKLSISNGSGVSGNPTLDVVEANILLNNIGGVLNTTKGGTGLTALGTALQVLRVNAAGTALEFSSVSGSGTVTSVSASQPAAGLTITGSPITSSGTLTFALANDLAALESLAGTGIAVRTGTDTWVQRSITAGTGIGVANGDGVAGVPTISLTTVGTAGTYSSVTTDTFGRVTAGTNPTTLAGHGITDAQPLDSDLTALANTATAGLYAVTAAGTSATRTIVGTTNQIAVTNGDGVLGNPTVAIADNPILPGTSGFVFPTGTTAQRPATPTAGTTRFNTTTGLPEIFYGGIWYRIGTASADTGLATILAVHSGIVPAATGTTLVPYDNTVPTNTEGSLILTVVITPAKATSSFRILIPITVDSGTSNRVVIASVFRGALNVGSSVWAATGGGRPNTLILSLSDSPGVATPFTYTLRVGIGGGSAQWYVNSISTGSDLGGALISTYQILELG